MQKPIINLDQLESAIEQGKVDALKGFGPTLKKKILAGIPRVRARRPNISRINPVRSSTFVLSARSRFRC